MLPARRENHDDARESMRTAPSAMTECLRRVAAVAAVMDGLVVSTVLFDQDVSVNVHFIPVPMMSFYKKKGYDIANYPVTFDNYSREISLPVYVDLNDEMVQRVIDAVVSSVNKIVG
jgi:dTDP-4-amino-4,6-dideoxygalactose transaminase